MDKSLRVLLVAAEATPFAKVGGLAEFAGSLPKALRKLGVDARLILPRYGDRSHAGLPSMRKIGTTLRVPIGPDYEAAHLLYGVVDGVPVYMVFNDQYFGNRDRVYGFNDDPQRFTFFSRAVIEALKGLDWIPDVLHATDWHTAPIPTWLKIYGQDVVPYQDIATLYTIRDFEYQGECGRLLLNFCRMEKVPHLDVERPGKVNWMAQGIAHADVISTVSPTYAHEICDTDLGGALRPLLSARRDRFFGILSGIDTQVWDPSVDPALAQTYDSETVHMRVVNKQALQRELHLSPERKAPLIGTVSRIDPHKGVGLLSAALDEILDRHRMQFVFLGTGEDEELKQQILDLQQKYPQAVRVLVRYDERMARRIYGGADLFVLPSQHESVSVAVMAAMRYGAVPVVRATGGLVDTVVDIDQEPDRGTGFTFTAFEAGALRQAIERALTAFAMPATWGDLQKRAMTRDFSWGASARGYIDLYRRATALHQRHR